MKSFIFVVLMLFSGWAVAEAQKMYLWNHSVPNALGSDEKDRPFIMIYPAEKPNGTAIVSCPGGGYNACLSEEVDLRYVPWLNALGVTVAVLEYRLPKNGYRHPNQMLDVQRAIRTVRKNAAQWHIDTAKIGVIGYSAGGHLASVAAVHFKDHPNPEDDTDRVSCRPDFAVLVYPVIQFGEPATHTGSQENLIGKNPPQELIAFYSTDKQVSEKTPPTILFSSSGDTVVPPENSLAFYLALRKFKIPAELHIYQTGEHGHLTRLAPPQQGTEMWNELAEIWLKTNGFLN